MGDVFIGGVSQVRVDVNDDDFVTTPIIFDLFAEEGNTWPDIQALLAGLHGGQQAPMGEDIPFEFHALNVVAADATALRDDGFDLVAHKVEFTSHDGRTVLELAPLILHVATSPIQERGRHGFVRVTGRATSTGKTPSYSIVHTP